MTDRIALGLAAAIVLLLCLDALVYDWGAVSFLARRFLDLVTWLAFWR